MLRQETKLWSERFLPLLFDSCEILFDIEDLCRYFMVEMKPDKYKKLASLVNKDFYDSVMEAIEIRPEFIELK